MDQRGQGEVAGYKEQDAHARQCLYDMAQDGHEAAGLRLMVEFGQAAVGGACVEQNHTGDHDPAQVVEKEQTGTFDRHGHGDPVFRSGAGVSLLACSAVQLLCSLGW